MPSLQVRPTNDPRVYEVQSEADSEKWYAMFVGSDPPKCPCKAYQTKKPPTICKHGKAYTEFIQETEGGRESEEDHNTDAGSMVTPLPSANHSRWVKTIHGKEFIEYQGLLAMAHEKGLQELGATFISVTESLALSLAWATFEDGRKFWEAGDATPTNVHAQVKAHFARIALTRAKARVLRDALNIGMVAVEELNED